MTKGQDVTAKAATDFRQPACLPARRGLRRTWLRNLVAGGSALLVASCQLLGDGPSMVLRHPEQLVVLNDKRAGRDGQSSN